MASLVIADEAKLTREEPRNLIPNAQVAAERVDEHQRAPLARPFVAIVYDAAVAVSAKLMSKDLLHGAEAL